MSALIQSLPITNIDQAETFFSLLSDDVRDIARSLGFRNCERLAWRIIYDRGVAERNSRQREMEEYAPEPYIRVCDIERVLADRTRPFLVSFDYCHMFARELEEIEPQPPDRFELFYNTLWDSEDGTEIVAVYSLLRLGSEMGLCRSVVDQFKGQIRAKSVSITGSLGTVYSGLERARIECQCEECRLVANRPRAYYDEFVFYAALMANIPFPYFRCDKGEIPAAVAYALSHAPFAYTFSNEQILEELLITYLEINEDMKTASDVAALYHHAGDYTRQAEAELGVAELSSRSQELSRKISSLLFHNSEEEDGESPVWEAIRAYLLPVPIASSRLLHGLVLADKICPIHYRIPF